MKTSSAKEKGRRLQKYVRDAIRVLGAFRGLVDEDVESRGMGQNGVDVILSPAARRIFPFAIECKNCESLNFHKVFWEHFAKYATKPDLKLLIHTKNHQPEPTVTMRFSDFIALYSKGLGSDPTDASDRIRTEKPALSGVSGSNRSVQGNSNN